MLVMVTDFKKTRDAELCCSFSCLVTQKHVHLQNFYLGWIVFIPFNYEQISSITT